VTDTPAPTTPEREPNPEAVTRIVAHLWGEDFVNLKAAVESFANGWTVVARSTPAEAHADDE
jgi:regulator of RNase E activity RraB